MRVNFHYVNHDVDVALPDYGHALSVTDRYSMWPPSSALFLEEEDEGTSRRRMAIVLSGTLDFEIVS